MVERAPHSPTTVTPTRRILWIDDEISEGHAEVRLLRGEGMQVQCAQSGETALACLESESFDAILLDLNMPGISGIDVLEELVARTNRIPVIILTGYGTIERAVRAMKLGAVDVLTKPIDNDELAARLREVRARYPEGTVPPPLTEAEWVRLQCERLAECISLDDALATVVRLLLNQRITLRYFHGCARALRLLLTSREPALAVLKPEARAAILATAPWPTDARLRDALAALEQGVTKQSQAMFAKRSGFSRAYLSRRLFRETGRRPSDWCLAPMLREGLRRLVKTAEPVQGIAHELGLEHSQFDRNFVNIFGIPPTTFRRRVPALGRSEDTQS
jgi:DNA-binding response OmpR family regulator/methylphosphotriester-DNA--protein-cysteine methyltransferase